MKGQTCGYTQHYKCHQDWKSIKYLLPIGANPESNDRVVRTKGQMSRMAAEPTATPDDMVMMVSPAVEQGWGIVVMVMTGRETEELGKRRLGHD